MGNTNFQTIHQMGTAISNMVKQATGRDAVQNIDMEHVTVAQNHRYEEVDVSGQVVSFQAGEAGIPFEKMLVQIAPVQDLHGYDHPWPAGGGKNLVNIPDSTTEITTQTEIASITLKAGTYILSADIKNSGAGAVNIRLGSAYSAVSGSTSADGWKRVWTDPCVIEEEQALDIIISGTVSGYIASYRNIMVESGSTATAYAPYSNICPITGWTMVNVYQAGQNMEDARVYRFTFPSEAGIVYGGTLDVISGELVVDRTAVDMGTLEWTPNNTEARIYQCVPPNMKAVIEPPYENRRRGAICSIYPASENIAISDRMTDNAWLRAGTLFYVRDMAYDSAASFKTAVSGAQLVYELATPQTYTLSASQVQTILGQNHIWADTGDIEVKFTNVKELY